MRVVNFVAKEASSFDTGVEHEIFGWYDEPPEKHPQELEVPDNIHLGEN